MQDDIFMNEAYKMSLKALKNDEVPVGAVIVFNGKIIAKAHNKKEKNNDPLGHAEIIAIRKAAKKIGDWRLNKCDIYITLEPCSMCLSACIQARIKNIYYGSIDKKSGSCGGLFSLTEQKGFNHYPNIFFLKNDKFSDLIKNYFKNKRLKK